jgi:hypothetical protein
VRALIKAPTLRASVNVMRRVFLIGSLAKDVFGHDQSCKAIGQSIHPCTVVCGGMTVGPDNIESGVDLRDCKSMQSGMREGKRCQIVRMGYLLHEFSKSTAATTNSLPLG